MPDNIPEELFSLRKRLYGPITLFVGLFAFGTFGYFFISILNPPDVLDTSSRLLILRHAIYQTAITLAGVGFSDVLESQATWTGTLFTVFLALVGIGFLMYFISTVTAFIVGGELRQIMETRAMEKRIRAMENHYIVCGAGENGRHVISELIATERQFVVIENDPEQIERLRNFGNVCYIQGDATEDELLIKVGIERARGLMSVLPSDKDNLLVVITARQLNPTLRVVSRCIEEINQKKLIKVGADAVVTPAYIGGLRMVSEMVRPTVTTFLDVMLRDKRAIRFENLTVPKGNHLVNKTLAEAALPDVADINVIAARPSPADDFIYNPHGNLVLNEGIELVVVGTPTDIQNVANHYELY